MQRVSGQLDLHNVSPYHLNHYIYSTFSGLPSTYTHYNPYISSAFSGLPATYKHYDPYVYSAFSGCPRLTPNITPIFTAPLVGCSSVGGVEDLVWCGVKNEILTDPF